MIGRGKADKKAARNARLSAALRENLKRRKAQARGRAQNSKGLDPSSSANDAEPAQSPDFRRNRGSD